MQQLCHIDKAIDVCFLSHRRKFDYRIKSRQLIKYIRISIHKTYRRKMRISKDLLEVNRYGIDLYLEMALAKYGMPSVICVLILVAIFNLGKDNVTCEKTVLYLKRDYAKVGKYLLFQYS